jgi:hypothetical protein
MPPVRKRSLYDVLDGHGSDDIPQKSLKTGGSTLTLRQLLNDDEPVAPFSINTVSTKAEKSQPTFTVSFASPLP